MLMETYASYQMWHSIVIALLLIMVLLVLFLAIFIFLTRRSGEKYTNVESMAPLGSSNGRALINGANNRTMYARIPFGDTDKLITKIPFHDISSDGE